MYIYVVCLRYRTWHVVFIFGKVTSTHVFIVNSCTDTHSNLHDLENFFLFLFDAAYILNLQNLESHVQFLKFLNFSNVFFLRTQISQSTRIIFV